jgi:hypothetical protein
LPANVPSSETSRLQTRYLLTARIRDVSSIHPFIHISTFVSGQLEKYT